MTMRSAKPPGANPAAVSGDRDNVLARCLPLDLEVGRADERIHALAGVRPDTGQSVVIPRVGNNLAPALARLDELADGADFVLGHNVIAFDLPYLRSAVPACDCWVCRRWTRSGSIRWPSPATRITTWSSTTRTDP